MCLRVGKPGKKMSSFTPAMRPGTSWSREMENGAAGSSEQLREGGEGGRGGREGGKEGEGEEGRYTHQATRAVQATQVEVRVFSVSLYTCTA